MYSVESFRKYEHLKIEELCRICLSKKEQMVMMSECGLEDMLLECASVQVCGDDGLCLICNHCANKVKHWYVFRQEVIKSFEVGKWLMQQKFNKTKSDYAFKQLDQVQTQAAGMQDTDQNSEIARGNEIDSKAELDLEGEAVCENEIINTDIKLSVERGLDKQGNLVATTYEESVAHNFSFKLCNRIKEIRKNIKLAEKLITFNNTCENIYQETSSSDQSQNEHQNFSCDQCGLICVSVYDLNIHKQMHTNKRYECSKCGKCFKQSQTLNDHMRRHYDSRNYACEICEKKFYKLFNVTEHMRIHTGERPFKCEYCVKTFTRGLLLRNHIKKAHTGEKRFICEVCSKSFVDSYQLKIHMRTHTGEKPFPCDKCEKAFAMQGQLKSHIKYKHTLEKDFICNICGKAFTAKHTLDEHLRTHTGEKREPRHKCSTCGKKCITTTQLKIHIKSAHTGERPFPCQMCTKRFVTKTAMESHMRTHTGEKSFVCYDCGKAFSAKSSLKIHERIHSGERPFKCSLCGKSFAQGSTLKTHMKVHR